LRDAAGNRPDIAATDYISTEYVTLGNFTGSVQNGRDRKCLAANAEMNHV